jgi:hypothetical protein
MLEKLQESLINSSRTNLDDVIFMSSDKTIARDDDRILLRFYCA